MAIEYQAIYIDTKEQISADLEYWRKKKEHFEQTKNEKGIRVAKLLLDRYLDKYNQATS
jgi:hypothetical protein